MVAWCALALALGAGVIAEAISRPRSKSGTGVMRVHGGHASGGGHGAFGGYGHPVSGLFQGLRGGGYSQTGNGNRIYVERWRCN